LRAQGIFVALVALVAVSPRPARAQEPRPARAQEPRDEAQAFFEAARALMGEGRYAEACAKLERSEALDPGIGTEFNLARCYDLAGRPAAASATYGRAIAAMHAAGQSDREAVARDLLGALQPRIAHVSLNVRLEGMEPGFELRLDGARVERTAWGAPIPVDPGSHVVTASAPASSAWRSDFTIDRDAQSVTVDVPPLAPILVVTPLSPLPPAREVPSGRGGTQRTLAVILGALGVGGLGVGTYYGLHAAALKSDAGPHCGNGCDSDGVNLTNDSLSAGNVSTISFVIGGVLLATGAVLWFTAPSETVSR
jgi:hypothetical protein